MIEVDLRVADEPGIKLLIRFLVHQAGINICECDKEFLKTPGCYCPCMYNWTIDELGFDIHSCRVVINGKEHWIKAQTSTKKDHDHFEELCGNNS